MVMIMGETETHQEPSSKSNKEKGMQNNDDRNWVKISKLTTNVLNILAQQAEHYEPHKRDLDPSPPSLNNAKPKSPSAIKSNHRGLFVQLH